MKIENFLTYLNAPKEVSPGQYMARCPAHDDKKASLSVKVGKDGKILVCCHAGCTAKEVVTAMGLTMADLFPESQQRQNTPRKVIATYAYRDENGNLIGEKVRYQPKGFCWRVVKPDGTFDYHIPKDVPPYNLPMLAKANKVVLVEGEKDVDSLNKIGIVATTLPNGAMAGKWPARYTKYFAGKQVVIIPDNDAPGEAYAQSAATALQGVASSVAVFSLRKWWPDIPAKGDVTDYIERYGNAAVANLQKLTAPLQVPTNGKKAKGVKAVMKGLEKAIAALDPAYNARYPENDNGSGRLFADLVESCARFVPERGKWYVYDGMKWAEDKQELVVRELCKAVADEINVYAIGLKDRKLQKEYMRHTNRWLNYTYRKTIIADAASVHPIYMAEFDADTYLFNCLNGTLDLRTGAFRAHDPADKITKVAHVVYDPTATCLRFIQFLSEVMSGDEDKSAFLQKALGYALGGSCEHECMFFLYGPSTRNGKSTLMESVLEAFGDYGRTTAPETLAARAKNSAAPSEDIARLAGIRLTNISEPPRNMRLNAAQVKTLTGNDSINARFLHENSFDFRPQFKIYVNTNYLPDVDDMSLFSSNRLYVIGFTRHFDPAEQDRSLKRVFRQPQAQSAILNWLLEGYRLLQEEGFTVPASVKKETDSYCTESNKIALFVADEMVEDPGAEERTAFMYVRYKAWCEENGYLPENDRNFRKMLQTIGRIERRRPQSGGEKTTLFVGYRLKGRVMSV